MVAFVYCPNPKCWAKSDRDEGYSWRYVQGGTKPKNCRQCYTAFKLGPEFQKDGRGISGSKPASRSGESMPDGVWSSGGTRQNPAKNAGTAGGEESRVQFIAAESGAIRNWLLKQHKDRTADPAIAAAMDTLVPKKALTQEEQRQEPEADV